MPIQPRAYHGGLPDQLLIADLIAVQPAYRRHLIDLPYRLACPDTRAGRNAAIWQAADGQAVAFAAWQVPWAALDVFLHPGRDQGDVADQVFGWADRRFWALDAERGYPLPYWIEYRDDDPQWRDLGRAHGFGLDERRYFQFSCKLAGRAGRTSPRLPDGFRLRPLAGQAEVGAYAELHRAAFGTPSMTAEWRAATLRCPQYVADLDLVAVAPDGSLAGFCVGWLDRARRIGQIEPAGVHPDYQRLGLGRALVAAVLDRLAAAGADQAIVESDTDNTAAVAAYQSAGFRASRHVHAVGKRLA